MGSKIRLLQLTPNVSASPFRFALNLHGPSSLETRPYIRPPSIIHVGCGWWIKAGSSSGQDVRRRARSGARKSALSGTFLRVLDTGIRQHIQKRFVFKQKLFLGDQHTDCVIFVLALDHPDKAVQCKTAHQAVFEVHGIGCIEIGRTAVSQVLSGPSGHWLDHDGRIPPDSISCNLR